MFSKHLAYSFAQALTERDPKLYASLLHPEYVNHNAFAAPGKAGSVAVFEGFLHAFPDLRVTLEDAVEEGDTLAGRCRYVGTFMQPFLSYLPTGRQLELRSIDLWTVRDGKLAEHWDELNTLDFFLQLGAATTPPPGVHPEVTH